MTAIRTSVKLLPPAQDQDQPADRIGHLHELCAHLNNESTIHQAVEPSDGEPPRKRQRLSETSSTSFDQVHLQRTVVLASIDVVSVSRE